MGLVKYTFCDIKMLDFTKGNYAVNLIGNKILNLETHTQLPYAYYNCNKNRQNPATSRHHNFRCKLGKKFPTVIDNK